MNDNKLIAEFMDYIKGFDIIDDNKYQGEITLSNNLMEEQIDGEISHFEDRYGVTPIAKESELQYHKSWDWLIPVVEKIESYNVSVNINGLYCVFNKNVAHQVTIRIEAVEMNEGGKSAWVLEDEYLYHSDVKDSKIEAVYQAVVEFIKHTKDKETTDNGYNVEQVKEYYLNSGFPRYYEEPFLS